MKDIFKIYNSFCSSYVDKSELLKKLAKFLKMGLTGHQPAEKLFFANLQSGGKPDPLKVFQLVGLIHQKIRESEKIANTDKRKHFGIYYTDYSIARHIAKESLGGVKKEDLENFTFYEPCVGSGIFAVAYLDEVLERVGRYDEKMTQKIVDQIYVSDIDAEAVDLFLKFFPLYVKSKYNFSIRLNPRNAFKGDVLFENYKGSIKKVNPKEIFAIQDGFDVVLTNPPYKLLKANSNKYNDESSKNQYAFDIKKILEYIKGNNVYRLNQGTLNYYKIFLEEILEHYTHSSSRVGAIIPITLLNDKQSELLRKNIINRYTLSKIYIIPEKNDFFPDISQAFCFFTLDKKGPGNVIRINPKVINQNDFANEGVKIDISHIAKISDTAPIVIESEIGWGILQKLNTFSKLKNLTSIRNARGELDLTLDKGYITKNRTSLPLLRGNNVNEFSYSQGEFFTDERFIKKIPEKHRFILKERLVCQQISNIHLEKRLKFAKIPGNVILGNSCNFVSFDESLFGNQEVSLDYLLGIFNSMLLNWRFKITNSNNHISNYELAELPIAPASIIERREIEALVNLIRNGDKKSVYELNMRIFKLYGLTKIEQEFILGKHQKSLTSIFRPTTETFLYAA